MPPIGGLDSFEGPAFHTARWRHDVDLAGRRVAVVGTGCSAIQVVPAIQPIVEHVDVYQRSPGWTIPKMDYAYSERAQRLFERFPALQRLDRAAIFAFMELGAAAMTGRRWLLPPARALARRQITKAIDDPELRAKVTPGDEVGCKRLMLTDEWYPTLTKPNVELVADRIAEVTATGVRTEDGVERRAEVLVLATGFKSHGFVALDELGRTDARAIEIRPEAAEAFDRELRAALAGTVWHSGCTNWYVDENGNDPNQWPWLWSTYRRRTARIEPGTYELSTS